jgi:hypothetical protein
VDMLRNTTAVMVFTGTLMASATSSAGLFLSVTGAWVEQSSGLTSIFDESLDGSFRRSSRRNPAWFLINTGSWEMSGTVRWLGQGSFAMRGESKRVLGPEYYPGEGGGCRYEFVYDATGALSKDQQTFKTVDCSYTLKLICKKGTTVYTEANSPCLETFRRVSVEN